MASSTPFSGAQSKGDGGSVAVLAAGCGGSRGGLARANESCSEPRDKKFGFGLVGDWGTAPLRLPAARVRSDSYSTLLAALDQSDCLVVTGETGCGKSTQVGQFILDAAVDADGGGALGITCTQPANGHTRHG